MYIGTDQDLLFAAPLQYDSSLIGVSGAAQEGVRQWTSLGLTAGSNHISRSGPAGFDCKFLAADRRFRRGSERILGHGQERERLLARLWSEQPFVRRNID